MDEIHLIKIGGKIVDNADKLSAFLTDFGKLKGKKILIHGGGKTASQICVQRGISVHMIDGRRITDKTTFEVIKNVYSALNQKITDKLWLKNCPAQGIGGKDNHVLWAKKRKHPNIDFGYVGDLALGDVDIDPLIKILDFGYVPVFNALTQDKNGQVLNTNADTIASVLAQALTKKYAVQLTYCFEKNGVLTTLEDEHSFLEKLTYSTYQKMVESQKIAQGMLPKLDNGFSALQNKVQTVNIKNATQLLTQTGTFLHHE